MTHLRFIYYVFGHYKMILLQILGPFVPFVEFLEIFCPSSKFWKSVAFRSGFGEISPFIPQQGFGILLQLRVEVHFNSSCLSGRNDQWSAGWQSVSSLFCFSPHSHSSYHPSSLSLSLCLSLSLVLFLPLCFCLSSTLCFSLYLCLPLYLCFYLSLAHLFCVSLLILIPTLTRPVCPCWDKGFCILGRFQIKI